jgi:hypothetical protein
VYSFALQGDGSWVPKPSLFPSSVVSVGDSGALHSSCVKFMPRCCWLLLPLLWLAALPWPALLTRRPSSFLYFTWRPAAAAAAADAGLVYTLNAGGSVLRQHQDGTGSTRE